MAKKEMTSSVETIEVEAEKILDEARSKASDILRKANDEAGKILSTKVLLDEVKAECEQIIHKAKEEASKDIKESKKKASGIRTATDKEMEKITKRIVDTITGKN